MLHVQIFVFLFLLVDLYSYFMGFQILPRNHIYLHAALFPPLLRILHIVAIYDLQNDAVTIGIEMT